MYEFSAPKKSHVRFFRFFPHFQNQITSIRIWMSIITKLTHMHFFTTLLNIFPTFSSLFFDKQGEFSHFRAFPHPSSVLGVLYLTITSILDTFATKSTESCKNETIGSLSPWSSRKTFEKDFLSTEKYADNQVQSSHRSSFLTCPKDILIPLVKLERLITFNLATSDRVWRAAECARV